MVITFPHMGMAYVSVKALFDDLGVKTVVPPPITKKTLEIGTAVSPEMACLPLKINLGNYIQSIEKGADTIVLTGSRGPCRFGYYGVVQKEILKDLGYDIDMVILDTPFIDLKAFINRVRHITGNCSLTKAAKAFLSASKVVTEMDELLDMTLKKRPRELKKGDTDRLLQSFEKDMNKVHGSSEISQLINKYKFKCQRIKEKPNCSPLRIGLVGEIYTLIEPFVNLNIEKKLGDLGVEVHRSMTVNSWVKNHLSVDIKYRKESKEILRKAEAYLKIGIGGHAKETIASTVNYADEGLDGAIQVLPFGCMPEIVAESILPTISRDLSFPVMTFTVDELTGEAGYLTRLEAFVDLLQSKKGQVV